MINDIWFAGVIDSDGFISINKRKNRYVVKVGLVWKNSSLTDIILKNIQQEYGGHLTYENHKNNLGMSDCIRWRVEARLAENVIERILPYLVLKKQEGELCLLSRKIMKNKGKNNHIQEKMFYECKELKKLH